MSTLPSPKYAGKGTKTILDGANEGSDFHSGNWLGFKSDNVTAIVQLKNPQTIQEVRVRFLSHLGSWIFSPKETRVYISKDGKKYYSAAQEHYNPADNPPSNKGFEVKEFKKLVKIADVRFIKFEIKNVESCPDWHPGKGGKAWLFLDELSVN